MRKTITVIVSLLFFLNVSATHAQMMGGSSGTSIDWDEVVSTRS
ncbi:MAG: hypothetical protein AAB413_03855 [Patescibacteria group bacterium]